MPRRERLSIAHVTPHPWGAHHEVNDFVEEATAEFAEPGHRVLVAAPSDSRRAIRTALEGPTSIFDASRALQTSDGGAPVLAVGQGIPMPRGPKQRAAPVPLDVSRTLDQLLPRELIRMDLDQHIEKRERRPGQRPAPLSDHLVRR